MKRCGCAALAALLCLLAGCVSLPALVATELRPPAADAPNAFAVQAARVGLAAAKPLPSRGAFVLPKGLEHGQIVVSENGGAVSLFYSLFAAEYRPWVHAGILAIEGGEAVVYEAVGSFVPIPGMAPTTTVSGTLRRVSLERFAAGKLVVGVYAPPAAVDRARLVAFARAHYEAATPFDPFFDLDDPAALYCTELVALALVAAGHAPIAPTRMHDSRSTQVARDWLHIRAARVVLAGQLVEDARPVVRFSPRLNDDQIAAWFEVKRELHRRFDATPRLGNVFEWRAGGLRLRDAVDRFVAAGLAAFADSAQSKTEDVAQRIRSIAAAHFDASQALRR